MNERKILLGGGGSADEERAVLERFAQRVDPTDSVLYLPVAAAQPDEAYSKWIASALTPFGIRHIDMWTTLAGQTSDELDRYGSVFIGGGTTYRLLHRLRVSGFDTALTAFVDRGGVFYGGSAGAIVCGRDIGTCAYMDENVVGLSDTAGLDRVGGTSIWCHYTPEDDPLIQAYVKRTGLTTIALSEPSGLWVAGCRRVCCARHWPCLSLFARR